MTAPQARRIDVEPEPLLGDRVFDYADAFEVDAARPDDRTAEQLARVALEQAPAAVRVLVWRVHRHVLRGQQGPLGSPEHVFGFTIVHREPDAVVLHEASPLLDAHLVIRRRLPTRVSVATFLTFHRPRVTRALWVVVGPLHRRVAPLLLERAAATGAAPAPAPR